MSYHIYNKVKNVAPLCLLALGLLLASPSAQAQVGEHRNELAVGVSGGYVLSQVSFSPSVPQGMQGGLTGGLTVRYTCEKYFNSVCAIVGEVNYAQLGWKESILTTDDEPVVNEATGLAEAYSRRVSYVQVPLLARMGWGRERSGFQFFFQIGPQFGYWLSESAEANFDLEHPNIYDRASHISGPSVGGREYSNMYFKPVENKVDYGISAGLGLEFSNRHIGHFLLEGRYYFGLGNIYGNTKRDYFGKSDYQTISVKLTYLMDIMKTKNSKIK